MTVVPADSWCSHLEECNNQGDCIHYGEDKEEECRCFDGFGGIRCEKKQTSITAMKDHAVLDLARARLLKDNGYNAKNILIARNPVVLDIRHAPSELKILDNSKKPDERAFPYGAAKISRNFNPIEEKISLGKMNPDPKPTVLRSFASSIELDGKKAIDGFHLLHGEPITHFAPKATEKVENSLKKNVYSHSATFSGLTSTGSALDDKKTSVSRNNVYKTADFGSANEMMSNIQYISRDTYDSTTIKHLPDEGHQGGYKSGESKITLDFLTDRPRQVGKMKVIADGDKLRHPLGVKVSSVNDKKIIGAEDVIVYEEFGMESNYYETESTTPSSVSPPNVYGPSIMDITVGGIVVLVVLALFALFIKKLSGKKNKKQHVEGNKSAKKKNKKESVVDKCDLIDL